MGAAEVVGFSGVVVGVFRRGGIDVHSADGIALSGIHCLKDSPRMVRFNAAGSRLLDHGCTIVVSSGENRPASNYHSGEVEGMTYLEVVFNYGAIPGENELRAIDTMREVYGIRRVQFNAKERTVRVEFDASRLKQDAVAKLLRNAGVDVREIVALA